MRSVKIFRTCAISAASYAILSGCVVDRASNNVAGGVVASTGTCARCEAFSPVELRVHPLTQVRSEGTESRLTLHVELRDRFGDSVKAIGTLRVDILRPGQDEPAIAWEVTDLEDAAASTRRFDPSTRTYRVPLRGPSWMRDEARSLSLRVTFVTRDPEGGERTISDRAGLE
jgi:hypothetical protein